MPQLRAIAIGFGKTVFIIAAVAVMLFTAASVFVQINKQQILHTLRQRLAEAINGQISYESAEIKLWRSFPFAGLDLRHVLVADSLGQPMLQVEAASGRFNLLQLLTEETTIRDLQLTNGRLNLFVDTAGYTNHYLLQPQQGGKQSGPVDLSKAVFTNLSVEISHQPRSKQYSAIFRQLLLDLTHQDDIIVIDADIQATIIGLGFNLEKGSYLKNNQLSTQVQMHFAPADQHLSFDYVDIFLNEQAYRAKGNFWLEGDGFFTLDVATTQAPYQKLKDLFSENIQAPMQSVSLAHPIDAAAQLKGSLAYKTIPDVQVQASVEDNILESPIGIITQCKFDGNFSNRLDTNRAHSDANSVAILRSFSGNWEDIRFTSDSIRVENLDHPRLAMSIASSLPLTVLNSKLNLQTLHFSAGDATLRLDYDGPIKKDMAVVEYLQGQLRFSDAVIRYTPRNFVFSNGSGVLRFGKDQLVADNLRFRLGPNQFIVNVQARNPAGISSENNQTASIRSRVYTPNLDIAALRSIFAARTSTERKNRNNNNITQLGAGIDDALDNGLLQLQLQADRVHFRQFSGNNLKGDIAFHGSDIRLNNISMLHADGSIAVNGTLTEHANHHAATLEASFNSVDVKKVFRSFEDFGQDGISYENLEGNLTADAQVRMQLDNEGTLKPGSVNGEVSFSLTDGALVNYEPVQDLRSFIFRNRDLSHVAFAELKNTLTVEGRTVHIPRMEIQSTAIGMFVEGVYDAGKEDTKIDIQVPLRGIKRDSTHVPENKGVEAPTGTSIYLQGKNDDSGKVRFRLNVTRTLRRLIF